MHDFSSLKNASDLVTACFIFCIVLLVALRFWFDSKQLKKAFVQKTATPAFVAEKKSAIVGVFLFAIGLLGWTLFGGLNALNTALLSVVPSAGWGWGAVFKQPWLLFTCFLSINFLIQLCYCWRFAPKNHKEIRGLQTYSGWRGIGWFLFLCGVQILIPKHVVYFTGLGVWPNLLGTSNSGLDLAIFSIWFALLHAIVVIFWNMHGKNRIID